MTEDPQPPPAPPAPSEPLVQPPVGPPDQPAPTTRVADLAVEARPWRSPLLYTGLGLLVAGFAGYGTLWALDRQQAYAVGVACVSLFYAGKEAGIPLGILSLKGDPWLVGGGLLWLDVAMTLILYPFVAAATDGAHRSKGLLGSTVRATRRRADKRRKLLDRYGAVGLWLFMIVPFGFNGPLVGMVLSRLAGLRAAPALTAILAAIVSTTVAWTILCVALGGLEFLKENSFVPTVIAMSVAAFAISLTVWDGIRQRRRERAGLQ